MKTRKSLLKLFKIAKLHYQKFTQKFNKISSTDLPKSEKTPPSQYSHKIYINPSDYYLNQPVTSILRPLNADFETEEIIKVQNFINTLSLKSSVKTTLKEEKVDFENIQNYIANPNYTIR